MNRYGERTLGWGDAVVEMVATDLRRAFLEMRGFSPANIWRMRQLHMVYSSEAILAIIEGRQIRKVFHEDEWRFSIIDVIDIMIGGGRPRKYWSDLKKKLLQEGYDQLSEKIGQLKMQSSDGKFYTTDYAMSRGTRCLQIEREEA